MIVVCKNYKLQVVLDQLKVTMDPPPIRYLQSSSKVTTGTPSHFKHSATHLHLRFVAKMPYSKQWACLTIGLYLMTAERKVQVNHVGSIAIIGQGLHLFSVLNN